MQTLVKRFLTDRSGASAMEYCFIASLIAIGIVTGATSIGGRLNHFFLQIAAVN